MNQCQSVFCDIYFKLLLLPLKSIAVVLYLDIGKLRQPQVVH